MLPLLTSSRLMLYLEWMLLGITAFTTIVAALIDISSRFPIVAIVCIVTLALMGFKLPKNQLFHQILYILVEFALVWLPFFNGDSVPTFQLLGAVIVIRSRQMFKLPGHLIVTGGVFLYFVCTALIWQQNLFVGICGRVVRQIQLPNQIQYNTRNVLILKLSTSVYFGLILVFLLLLINALLAERQSREKLSVALTQIRQYALQIEDQATLEERNRIAREIHDALGHTLTAQSIQLDSGLLFLHSHRSEEAGSFFTTAKALCTQALQEVRQSVTTLRSDYLSEKPLKISIATLIKNFQTATNIIPSSTVSLSQAVPHEVSSAVYRIVQEALTNITRHSAATEVTIQLVNREQTLYILIKDNGKGFNPEENSTGFGIQGMRERTMVLDGQFNLVSQPGTGCLITVQIPLPRLL